MWFLPLLVLGAIAVAAASTRSSSRDTAPPSRQLAAPPPSPEVLPRGYQGNSSSLPGPIAVLGEILRIGKNPPPVVILCAIAEAESIGRNDLVSDIVNAFVAPVVYAHEARRASSSCAPVYANERGSY